MKITWIGHASFLIEDSQSRKLLTDPFDGSVGYNIFKEKVDLVTISHHHFDHDYINELKGNPKILDKVGLFNICDIPIEGIHTYHDHDNGLKRGDNIVYTFEIDNYKICHLGDVGHPLSNKDIQKIGNVDILFIPVGGNFTINAKEAKKIAHEIKPHVIIPMHFKTDKINFPIAGVEEFLIEMKNVEKINSSTIEIDGKLQDYNKVIVLQYRN